jgi:hypothetical protein
MISLSMVGANANTGTRIYPDSNRAGPYVQQSVCAHCINSHWGARRGELQARQERRLVLQVPARMFEASANIVVCGVRANERG